MARNTWFGRLSRGQITPDLVWPVIEQVLTLRAMRRHCEGVVRKDVIRSVFWGEPCNDHMNHGRRGTASSGKTSTETVTALEGAWAWRRGDPFARLLEERWWFLGFEEEGKEGKEDNMQAAALGNWEGGSVICRGRDTEGGTGLDLGMPEAWMTVLLHQTPLFLQAFHHLCPLQELAKAAAPPCSPCLCSLLALSFAWVIPPSTLCLSSMSLPLLPP